MARGLNRVTLIGDVSSDLKPCRRLSNGNAVLNLTLASTDSWIDRETREPQERTEWHRVAMFGRFAEEASERLRKGSTCYIEGRLQTRKYEKDGITRYITEIIVDHQGDFRLIEASQFSSPALDRHPRGSGQSSPQNQPPDARTAALGRQQPSVTKPSTPPAARPAPAPAPAPDDGWPDLDYFSEPHERFF